MTPRAATTLIILGLTLTALGGQWLLGARPANTEATPVEKPFRTPAATRSVVPPHRPEGTRPSVATGLVNHHGEAVGVACMTCHTTREPNRENGLDGAIPREFHQGLVYAHAGQSCLSCHHAGDYDSLRLADGRKLAFNDAQNLCAQCHGPQTRDYLNGSHGGMKGYWDKTKGERTRNTCTDCHDPHAPAYPAWTPVFPPRDAAARQQAEREAGHPVNHTPLYYHD